MVLKAKLEEIIKKWLNIHNNDGIKNTLVELEL